MTSPGNDAVQAAIGAELRLLDPAVRASSDLLEELLDPDFTEIGASGERWDRGSIISALTQGTPPSYLPPTVSAIAGVLVAPGAVQVTFTTDEGERRVHRASLWRFTDGRLRIYFHQSTPTTSCSSRAGRRRRRCCLTIAPW